MSLSTKTDPEYEQAVREAANIVINGEALLFVGSGISVDPPSRLPTGRSLKVYLVGAFCEEEPVKVKTALQKSTYGLGLEEVCQVIYERIGDRLLEELRLLLVSPILKPNLIHKFLAQALKRGNVVVTPNYDILIEKACGGHVTKLYIDKTEFGSLLGDKAPKLSGSVFKIHGSFMDVRFPDRDTLGTVATTLSRIGKLPDAKKKVLQQLLERYAAIFLGYSAAGDIDVYPVLVDRDTPVPRKVFWVKQSLKTPHILPLRRVVAEKQKEARVAKPNRNWETFNSDNIIVRTTDQFGAKSGTQIICSTRTFILDLSRLLSLNEKSDFWILADEANHSTGSAEAEHSFQSSLTRWAQGIGKCTRYWIIGEFAIAARQWSLAIEYLDKAKSVGESESWADIERRIGWCYYQRNSKDDTLRTRESYERSLKAYRDLPDKLGEARICSSLGLLLNTRMNDLEAAQEYSETAWEVLRSLFPGCPTQITGSEGDIDEVANRAESLAQWALRLSENISVENTYLLDTLSAAWHNIGHVCLRRCNDPARIIRTAGYQSALIRPLKEPEVRLLHKALGFTMASELLMDEIGDLRGLAQANNIIGLTYTRLKHPEQAITRHERSSYIAACLGWPHEYAQACRNLGVAFAYQKERRKALSHIWTAIKTWFRLRRKEGRWQDTISGLRLFGSICLSYLRPML
jgi:tetratricopeptide (TPR) repeat protein